MQSNHRTATADPSQMQTSHSRQTYRYLSPEAIAETGDRVFRVEAWGVSIIRVCRLRADPNYSTQPRRNERSRPHKAVQGRLRRLVRGSAVDTVTCSALDSLARLR